MHLFKVLRNETMCIFLSTLSAPPSLSLSLYLSLSFLSFPSLRAHSVNMWDFWFTALI